jgi:hypothetical protein
VPGIEERSKSQFQIICLCDAIITYPQGKIFVKKKVNDVFACFWEGAICSDKEEIRPIVISIMRKAKIPLDGKKAVMPIDVIIDFENLRA